MKEDKRDEIRSEYPRKHLGPGIRGKYLGDYRSVNNLVLLKPDVAEAFPTEEAVNAALRSLIEAEQRSIEPKKNSDG
jgi:hypothetical protein